MIDQKEKLRNEIETMNNRFEDEISELSENFRKEFEKLNLKDDFVRNQNENFRLQKEITLLLRDKTVMDEEIENSLQRIKELEMKIYKIEMYDLKVEDPYIQTINFRNLRAEHSASLQSSHIFH